MDEEQRRRERDGQRAVSGAVPDKGSDAARSDPLNQRIVPPSAHGRDPLRDNQKDGSRHSSRESYHDGKKDEQQEGSDVQQDGYRVQKEQQDEHSRDSGESHLSANDGGSSPGSHTLTQEGAMLRRREQV